MLGYLSADIMFREANSFLRAKLEENCELRRTDNVQGHYTSSGVVSSRKHNVETQWDNLPYYSPVPELSFLPAPYTG